MGNRQVTVHYRPTAAYLQGLAIPDGAIVGLPHYCAEHRPRMGRSVKWVKPTCRTACQIYPPNHTLKDALPIGTNLTVLRSSLRSRKPEGSSQEKMNCRSCQFHSMRKSKMRFFHKSTTDYHNARLISSPNISFLFLSKLTNDRYECLAIANALNGGIS